MLQKCAPGLPDSTHTALTTLFCNNMQLGISRQRQPCSFFQSPRTRELDTMAPKVTGARSRALPCSPG